MALPDKLFTKQNCIDIERNILDLKSKKSSFVFQKTEAERKLGEIKNKIRGAGKHLPSTEYSSLCKKQDALKKEKANAEEHIQSIQEDIQKKSLLKDEIKNEISQRASKELPDTITALKDHYIQFAADKTRVSSMRAMAAEFVEKLESISRSL